MRGGIEKAAFRGTKEMIEEIKAAGREKLGDQQMKQKERESERWSVKAKHP